MDEFEQSDLEKQTDDSNNTISKNAIHSKERENVWYTGCLKKFAIIRGTVHCCFAVYFCFCRVSDKTRNKCSKDSFIQILQFS